MVALQVSLTDNDRSARESLEMYASKNIEGHVLVPIKIPCCCYRGAKNRYV